MVLLKLFGKAISIKISGLATSSRITWKITGLLDVYPRTYNANKKVTYLMANYIMV